MIRPAFIRLALLKRRLSRRNRRVYNDFVRRMARERDVRRVELDMLYPLMVTAHVDRLTWDREYEIRMEFLASVGAHSPDDRRIGSLVVE